MKELELTSKTVPKGKRFCTICGEVKREHYFEGDSTHCSACCEKMLHTRLNAKYIPFALVLLVVVAVSVFLSVHTVPYCGSLLSAQAAVRDKRLTDACELYAQSVSDATDKNAVLLAGGKPDDSGSLPAPTWTFFEPGAYTWARYLRTYAMVYSQFDAANVAQSSLDKDVSARIPVIADLYEAKQAYDETLLFAQQTANQYSATEEVEDIQYDEIINTLTMYAEDSESRFVKGYIEYYKGRSTQYCKADDPASAIAYYDNVLTYIPDEFIIVYTAEADAAMTAQKYDAAIEAYEKILEKNKNETDAYLSIAEAADLGGNDEKCANALAQFDEGDPQRLRMEMRFALRSDKLDEAASVRERAQRTAAVKANEVFNKMLADQTIDQENRAILQNYLDYAIEDTAFSLVEGDTDAAFKTVYEEAFNYAYYLAYLTNDSGAFSQPLINLATLCASLVKDKDALQTIREIGECDETTRQLIDGELKLTMREVFVEGKAEII